MTTVPPNIRALLGFAKKSGKLLSGEAAVGSALKRNSAKLVILACDLPEKRKTHWESWCQSIKIKYVFLGTKEEFGRILGLSNRGVIAVTDAQMAAVINKQLGHTV